MDRRGLLATIAAGITLAAAGGGAAYVAGNNGVQPFDELFGRRPQPKPLPTPSAKFIYANGRPVPTQLPSQSEIYKKFALPRLTRVPLPGGEISALPAQGHILALTVDDGASAETIKGYCDFVEATNFRMTFFVTSQYDGWASNLKQLRRLVDAGNVQVANHTTTHKWLTRETDATVADQLTGCERYLQKNFGVTAKPYFRPPYGDIDGRVARIAADLGYSTPVLWLGSFGDAGKSSVDGVKMMAKRWLLPQHIVIGHANFPYVTHAFDEIERLLHERNLHPVTLDDVYLRQV